MGFKRYRADELEAERVAPKIIHGRLYGGAVVMEKGGAKNPNWKGGLHHKVCALCGAAFSVKNGRKDSARFCSLACVNQWQRETENGKGKKRPGTGNPGPRKARVAVRCAVCATETLRLPGHVKHYLYCSPECAKRSRLSSPRIYSRCKRGRRADLGDPHFRSRWEANYARFLTLLQKQGKIAKWEYEAQTFWFEKIRRGVRSYTPDFRVTRLDGTCYFDEVKGWMDPKSRTKLKRMKKYHPSVEVNLIDAKAYREIARKLGGAIPHWESEGPVLSQVNEVPA